MTNYKDNFNKFGFLVLRDVFTKEQCDDFKSSIVKFYFGENGESRNYYAPNYRNGKETVCPLAFNFTELEDLLDIFDNQKLIDTMKDLAGNKLMYLHHSDAHIDTVAGKGWHRDTDWQSSNFSNKVDLWEKQGDEEYCVIRVALYLQDHNLDQNGLFVDAGSHKKEGPTQKLYVKTKAGDVILFDSRLRHKGGHSGRRNDNRAAIYWAMGRDNVFSHQHIEAQLKRQINQLDLEKYEISENLKKRLEQNEIGY